VCCAWLLQVKHTQVQLEEDAPDEQDVEAEQLAEGQQAGQTRGTTLLKAWGSQKRC
jgi:hypothetical protein